MRQGAKAIIASLIAGAVLVPAALAATPEDIYRDLADNGKLDGAYTQAEVQAFLQSASVQGYGNPIVVTVPPAVSPPAGEQPAVTPATPAAPAAPTSGVAGTNKTIVNASAQPAAAPTTGVAGVQTPLTQTATADTLPFTGSELGLFALVGAALLLGGLALRASARRR